MTNPDKRSNASSNFIPTSRAQESSGNAKRVPTEITGQRFPKVLRLSGRDEFAIVFDHGLVASDKTLVVHAVRTPRPVSRIGLSVSKKVGSAPTRNYWKRCLREAFRRQREQLPTGMDIVVRPRRDARAEYQAIAASLLRLLKKLNQQLGS